MNNNVEKPSPLQEQFAAVFSHLREQEIEQFYAQYQLWSLRRRVPLLEGQISTMREHLAENQQMIQSLQPSALAMAVLARLQSNGVSDVDVLDRMLERGEGWLDRMMQRLDYCEQVEDFIQGDYTQWCVNSLDGAYDWLDPVLNPATEEDASAQPAKAESETTEEMVLQRLSLEDEEAMQQSIQANVYEPEAATQEIPVEAGAEGSTEEAAPLPAEIGEEPEAREDVTETEQTPETSTQETSSEAEAAAELASVEEEIAPWYSVNLDENAASDAGSQDAMNDWIKVLQADTGESPAVSEIQAAQAEAATPEAAEITAEELPIPELEDEAEHTYSTDETQAETAPAEQEQMPAETAISAEAEQTEEAATQPTDETAPASAEIETVASAQATEFPTPAEEAEAVSPDEPVEAEQPAEEIEQAEPVLVEEQSAATAQVTAGDDTEMAETSPAEQEAASDEPLPIEDQATLTEAPIPAEQEAAPDETLPLEDQASFIERDEAVSLEDQVSFIETVIPAEQEQGGQPPDLVVASETAEEASVLAETSGQGQMEEHRESEQELEELGDWQTWSANQDDDKTEPMALRAIQSSLELEPTVKLADLANNEVDTPADSTEESEATPREAASEPATPNTPEQHAAALVPAQTAYFEEPDGPVEAQTGWPASHEQTRSTAPGAQPVTPVPSPRAQWVTPLPPPEVRPQAKRGFWRRLFGWLRKN